MTAFTLLTIRVASVEDSLSFYRALGLEFELHAHGAGPRHWCARVGGMAFEIYPSGSTAAPSSGVRLGFAVGDVDVSGASLLRAGGSLVHGPSASPWGRRMVVADPDGNRVELTAAGQEAPLPSPG